MFFCYPFGHSSPENLYNYNGDSEQVNYIFFHDQEPIHLDIHAPLFDQVVKRNGDLNTCWGALHQGIVVSERDSDAVNQLCSQNNWRSYYYFFHGWAALEWFRGYNQSFLMPAPEDRTITKSFISPNRIVGGKRQHRVELMYHLLKRGIENAWISFPEVCPAENIRVETLAMDYPQHADMASVFQNAGLPMHFPGEFDHPMHSCWLSLFNESAESLAYVVTETVFAGRRHHLTEKTFKPICLGMPFVMVGTAGSLEYLRSYGFKTFDGIWDESYDLETDDDKRLVMIADLLKKLDSAENKQALFDAAIPIIKHNYEHFYNGGFEKILWDELTSMLNTIAKEYKING